MKIIKVPIEKCELWDKNPRGCRKKDFERLKNQIKRLGVYKPLIAVEENGHYTILGGNMRLMALRELGHTEAEISLVEAPTEKEKIEYSLSDNDRIGYYEEEALAELIYPHIEDIKLDDFKVDVGEPISVRNIVLDIAPLEGEALVDADEMNAAFSEDQLRELAEKDIEAFDWNLYPSLKINKSLAAYEFNQLCMGQSNVGSNISLLFNSHRLLVGREDGPSTYQALLEKNKKIIKSVARFMIQVDRKVYHPVGINHQLTVGIGPTKCVIDFKPADARDIINYYTVGKREIAILDPCHGWGGRLIGALATMKKIHYVGIDPAVQTNRGVRHLADFLLSAEKIKEIGSQVTLICAPFEDAVLPDMKFDIAITSPPYFNKEHYETDNPNQAYLKYKTLDEFNNIFLRKLISKTMNTLKDDGVFCLNMEKEFLRPVKRLCDEMKFKFVETENFKIALNNMSNDSVEPVYVIRK